MINTQKPIKKVFEGLVRYPTAAEFSSISQGVSDSENRLREQERALAIQEEANRKPVKLDTAAELALL